MRPAVALLCLLLGACATLSPEYEEPTVTLTSFRAVPSEGMAPSFEIGLRIINPNPHTLRLEGIVYTVSVNGHDLVKAVGKDFPPIEGYSQGDVLLSASTDLLAGVRFIGDLARGPGESLEYEFEAKLDLDGLYPSIRVRERGEFNLGPAGR